MHNEWKNYKKKEQMSLRATGRVLHPVPLQQCTLVYDIAENTCNTMKQLGAGHCCLFYGAMLHAVLLPWHICSTWCIWFCTDERTVGVTATIVKRIRSMLQHCPGAVSVYLVVVGKSAHDGRREGNCIINR